MLQDRPCPDALELEREDALESYSAFRSHSIAPTTTWARPERMRRNWPWQERAEDDGDDAEADDDEEEAAFELSVLCDETHITCSIQLIVLVTLLGKQRHTRRFKQYECRANSNLLLTADSWPQDMHKPTGDPEIF
ncbi:hypothetical protein ZWY2020_051546 [Hordeum vulgare]|nr:hypothetical protein ZWY2020_051546 [Hordeum vulgare]